MAVKGTSTSLAVNVAGTLCYIPFLGWMAAGVLLVVEKNKQVRWHAVQALLTYVVLLGVTQVAVPLMNMTVVLMPLAVVVKGLTGIGFLGL